MALPEGLKRIDNLYFEELVIEASPPPPADIGTERKNIADMDQVREFCIFCMIFSWTFEAFCIHVKPLGSHLGVPSRPLKPSWLARARNFQPC